MGTALLDRLVSLVVPPLCVACREPEFGGGAVCDGCAARLVALAPAQAGCRSPGLARAWAPFAYEGVARQVVMALKARSATQAARFMGGAIAARCPPGLLGGGVLVPVPGHPHGARRRGFDHAAAITRVIARHAGLEVVAALRRAPARPQVGLARAARRANAAGSVGVRPRLPPGLRVILVDDVYTTGATLEACALALRGAGAGEVVAVCFARTLARRPAGT
jgi:predicted amidophosphoribosyltransferase